MKKHIFVVDDDEAILDVLKIILEESGYKITIISDGRDLLNKINTQKPDLILLHIWLAGLDGEQITKQFKSDSKIAGIPIILISANNRGRQIAVQSGADGFIAKPFEIEHLVQTVKKHLRPKKVN